MKAMMLLILNLLIFCTVFGQSANDEQQLRDIIQKLEDSWNRDDFSFFKNETYAPDAIVVNPAGEVWTGQAEIAKGVVG
jgi:ketosteroid isomerase-like protein